MSIVKMKKLRLMAMTADRDNLLHDLMRLGCTELSGAEEKLSDPEWNSLIRNDDNRLNEVRTDAIAVKAALDALDKYAPEKRSMFYLKPLVKSGELFDDASARRALEYVRKIGEITRQIAGLYTEENRLNNKFEALKPWASLDLPLETLPTKGIIINFCVVPSGAVEFPALKSKLEAAAPASELYLASSDSEQHYMLFVCHAAEEEEAFKVLKPAGFSRVQFKDTTGTAARNMTEIKTRIEKIGREREALEAKIAEFKSNRSEIEKYSDWLAQQATREAAREKLLITEKSFYFEGWIMEPSLPKFEKVVAKYDCAYELSEPAEDDDVPIKLKNSKLIEPFNMVTEMYQLPAYDGIDPNPLFALFFAVFFGFMYADMGYGIVLIVLSVIVRNKTRLKGTMKHMFGLMTICGVTSFLFGAFFGGFFGDALKVICENLLGLTGVNPVKPILWDPLAEPMDTLILAICFGAVHIIAGMCIKVYLCFRDGKPLDALWDVGSWWVVFAGLAVVYLNGNPWVLIIGALMLVCTQGRGSKTVGGKIVGGIASLYDITSYLSDILSYARLMALMLASSVIASVINILGSMNGSVFIAGPLVFIVVFAFGHAFNMAINIIGTYVHAARLQYLEYFSKFYKGGGTPFNPLKIKTKYVDILEEEN